MSLSIIMALAVTALATLASRYQHYLLPRSLTALLAYLLLSIGSRHVDARAEGPTVLVAR